MGTGDGRGGGEGGEEGRGEVGEDREVMEGRKVQGREERRRGNGVRREERWMVGEC